MSLTRGNVTTRRDMSLRPRWNLSFTPLLFVLLLFSEWFQQDAATSTERTASTVAAPSTGHVRHQHHLHAHNILLDNLYYINGYLSGPSRKLQHYRGATLKN